MALHLLLLLHQNIILLFQIPTPAIGRFLLQMQPMLPGNIKEHRPAERIESLFPVVVPALRLIGIGKRYPQFLQCFFLLWEKLPVAIFTVKYMALMDVGRTLIQMNRQSIMWIW